MRNPKDRVPPGQNVVHCVEQLGVTSSRRCAFESPIVVRAHKCPDVHRDKASTAHHSCARATSAHARGSSHRGSLLKGTRSPMLVSSAAKRTGRACWVKPATGCTVKARPFFVLCVCALGHSPPWFRGEVGSRPRAARGPWLGARRRARRAAPSRACVARDGAAWS